MLKIMLFVDSWLYKKKTSGYKIKISDKKSCLDESNYLKNKINKHTVKGITIMNVYWLISCVSLSTYYCIYTV